MPKSIVINKNLIIMKNFSLKLNLIYYFHAITQLSLWDISIISQFNNYEFQQLYLFLLVRKWYKNWFINKINYEIKQYFQFKPCIRMFRAWCLN